MKRLIGMLVFFPAAFVKAQDSTGNLSISGYTEAYYTFDFNKPADHNLPDFIYSHNRHNEFTLNLGFIKAFYSTGSIRAAVALGAGTYMNANYAAEPGLLKNVYEASAGVKISQTKNLWLDAGIMPSHIGFESAINKDCNTVTRSMMADNTPYYEAGVKITFTTGNRKWLLSGMALNGWQRIKRVDGSSKMNWGTQLQYKPSENVLLNYSMFFGTDKPDSSRLNRLFHNLYGIFTAGKVVITAGADIGTEQKVKGSSAKNKWFATVLIAKYAFHKSWALAARMEYYTDKNGVIITTRTPNGFQTAGFSVNIDHSPFKNVVLRLEARMLNSRDPVFTKPAGNTANNNFITGSLAVGF